MTLRRGRLPADDPVMQDASPASALAVGTAMHAVNRLLRPTAPFVLIALAALAPFVLSTGSGVLHDMILAAAYVVMALGLNIVVGFAGLLDLGYVAFFAIGAYTSAYFASGFWDNAGPDGQGVAILVSGPASHLPGIHVNFLLVFVLAVAATTVAGTLIGVPTLRLRGDYVAIVTLAFGEIIGQVAANGGDITLFGGTLTAGPNNIGPIDKIDLPFLEPFDAVDPRPWYWFALGLVVLALVVTIRLRDSRIGRAWTALRDDETAAAASGIPIARTKLAAYATGAAFGGVSGAFIASYFSAVNAAQFQFSFSLFIFSMVVLGGVGSIRGVVVGAIALSAINSYLLPDVLYSLPSRIGLDFDFSAIASGVYGAIIVLVVLLRPDGLLPAQWAVSRRRLGGRLSSWG
jgi:branched-chain amino acid transport system permease protein